MKKWLYKSLVVSVALLTFGVITPNHEIWTNFDEERGIKSALDRQDDNQISSAYQLDDILIAEQPQPTIDTFVEAAKEQAYLKFGTRIGPVIEDEFETKIFPKIGEAIAMTVDRLGHDTLTNLSITEKPSGEYSEKIFHIVDKDAKKMSSAFMYVRKTARSKGSTTISITTHLKTTIKHTTTLATFTGPKTHRLNG